MTLLTAWFVWLQSKDEKHHIRCVLLNINLVKVLTKVGVDGVSSDDVGAFVGSQENLFQQLAVLISNSERRHVHNAQHLRSWEPEIVQKSRILCQSGDTARQGQSLAYNFDGLSGPASKGSATDSPVFHLLSLTRSGLKRSVNLLQETCECVVRLIQFKETYRSRSDSVDPDSLGSQLTSKGLGEGDDGSFGGRVVNHGRGTYIVPSSGQGPNLKI